MVREYLDAALQGCREKAHQKTQAFVGTLPAGLDDGEKFQALSNEWQKVHDCARKCGDNFDPELFIERENNSKPPFILQALMTGYAEGVYRMDALTQEMEKLACTKVNGTSVTFAACAKGTKNIIAIDLARALRVYRHGPFAVDDVPAPRA